MSKIIDSTVENDYGQFVILYNDDTETEYNNLPYVKYSNGKYNVSQTKLDCDSLQYCDITSKYTTNVNIFRDGILCLFSCMVISTIYTVNCVYSFYRSA